MHKSIFVTCLLICLVERLQGNNFFVSTNAMSNGTGTYDNPWKLQVALSHPKNLKPGDTVWIRGGIYLNAFDAQTSFSCFTKGAPNAPIIFRNYNHERVILDGDLNYTLYADINNCYHTWFWGLEISNSYSKDRKHTITGGITCTASEMKFINLIVHDTGEGIDVWKVSTNSEVYGCIVYHIGNNLNNNGNWEGHGHGMYLQNDTFGTRKIHNNIIFSTYGYGMKIWQTTTTAALGHFDIRDNVIFNGGAASENLGGVGNNSRTHNFFVVSNSVSNPVLRSSIVHNFTFSGTNTPRPPVNAFGLNYGMLECRIDSNVLTGQTRLGYNNTPIFKTSFINNKIMAGIPAAYGYYLWGFNTIDFPQNEYIPDPSIQKNEYYILDNKYESYNSHLIIYNWENHDLVKVNMVKQGWDLSDSYILVNVMDLFNDTIQGKLNSEGEIEVSMQDRTLTKAVGADKDPVSQFPQFGVFKLIRIPNRVTRIHSHKENNCTIFPNPCSEQISVVAYHKINRIELHNINGDKVLSKVILENSNKTEVSVRDLKPGVYWIYIYCKSKFEIKKIIVTGS